MISLHRAGLAASCSMLALFAASQAAQAADTPAATTVQEIVVTADKRPEQLKNVAASVTALPAVQLQQIGAVKLDDYAARIPGLTVMNASEAQARPSLPSAGSPPASAAIRP